ncbi:uncharacterized protein VTP21DRAFT_6384 [Calcarisporiella thermophila]|uniref:uncharacterized protein n=1 Tax=Calcarisporiella thermophila TaxID=911321 RepID=UPI0037429241
MSSTPKAKMIDCHAHIYPSSIGESLSTQLDRAKPLVHGIISVPVTLADAHEILDLSQNTYKDFIFAGAGLHPDQNGRCVREDEMLALEQFVHQNHSKLVCIGEVGLDYTPYVFASADNPKGMTEDGLKKMQENVLARHIKLSRDYGLPLNVHSRSAGHYTIDTLGAYGAQKVVLHAFDGKASYALKGVEMGYNFSVPPSIIRSPHKQTLVSKLPLSHLLLETDSPCLGPEKGVDNEPANIIVSAQEIARIKELDIDEVINETTENALGLFEHLKGAIQL